MLCPSSSEAPPFPNSQPYASTAVMSYLDRRHPWTFKDDYFEAATVAAAAM